MICPIFRGNNTIGVHAVRTGEDYCTTKAEQRPLGIFPKMLKSQIFTEW
jgi:hypothetical protein